MTVLSRTDTLATVFSIRLVYRSAQLISLPNGRRCVYACICVC